MRSLLPVLCTGVTARPSVFVCACLSLCAPTPALLCIYLCLLPTLPVTRLPACKCCTCTRGCWGLFLHMQHLHSRGLWGYNLHMQHMLHLHTKGTDSGYED